jgi:hypothetical protein
VLHLYIFGCFLNNKPCFGGAQYLGWAVSAIPEIYNECSIITDVCNLPLCKLEICNFIFHIVCSWIEIFISLCSLYMFSFLRLALLNLCIISIKWNIFYSVGEQ